MEWVKWVWLNAEKLAALGTVVAGFIALVALIVAAWQLIRSRSASREATAMEAYRSYLRSCVDKPHLGTWKMFTAWSGVTDPGILEDQTDEKSEAYVWQLSEMLMTCELGMLATSRDEAWLCTIETQVELHEPAIRHLWPTWARNYSPSLQDGVKRAFRVLDEKRRQTVLAAVASEPAISTPASDSVSVALPVAAPLQRSDAMRQQDDEA